MSSLIFSGKKKKKKKNTSVCFTYDKHLKGYNLTFLGKNPGRQLSGIFFIFYQKTGFGISYKFSKGYCMKCEILFSGENMEIYIFVA